MKILHPTDFSAAAEKARSVALDLAERLGATLHVVHVQRRFESEHGYLQPQIDSINPELLRQLERARAEEVENLRKRLSALTPPGGSFELRWGEPLPELLEIAPQFDLVVMGAHGDNPIDSYFLGGTAGRFVRRSKVPVITVRQEATVEPIRRVLVATDFGEASQAAWAFCLQLAHAGIKLVLAHVIDDPRLHNDAEHTRKVVEQLERLSAGSAERHVIREGDAVELLPEIAEEVGADMIAIGIRRHRAALGLLLGSRADALLRSSPRPLLSVPAMRQD